MKHFTMYWLDKIRGDLVSPAMWICVLQKAIEVEPSCTLRIAENIGPLVSSMCNDAELLFFKTHKHWRESILQFTRLLFEIVYEGKKEAVEIMIKYEGFLSFIVQCGFWGEEHRPDIVKMLNDETCEVIQHTYGSFDDELGAIVGTGRAIMKLMALDNENRRLLVRGKNLLEDIGMMPIISTAYNPTCTISFVEGFVRRFNTSEWDGQEFRVLHQLIVDGDCVDRGLVKEMIDLCLNCVAELEFNQALHLTMLPCTMMFSGKNTKKKYPSDTRVAFAIRAGLIEVCLGLIEYFGGHESFEIKIDRLSMFDSIWTILNTVHDISLHQKTAKAINNKRMVIEERLVRLEQSMDNTNNQSRVLLLDLLKSIVNISGLYCCRCNKSLSRTEVMQCNGCHRMTYCSKACQREDWQNGHELACCKSYTADLAGEFQGRVAPLVVPDDIRTATKLMDLEINMNMIQQKLFLDNAEDILSQAEALNLPLNDCVVRFDLCDCPPTIRVHDYRKICVSQKARKGFEDSRSEKNITCVYFSTFFYGEMDDLGDVPSLELQRLFPHVWLKQSK